MFFLWNQSSNITYPNDENVFIVSNHKKKKRLLCESMFVQIDRWTLILKMVEREVFHMKPKHQYHLSQLGQYVYGAQSQNERRLLCESVFIPTEKWTLIPKLVEKEVFLMKPKHQFTYPSVKNEFVVPNH